VIEFSIEPQRRLVRRLAVMTLSELPDELLIVCFGFLDLADR